MGIFFTDNYQPVDSMICFGLERRINIKVLHEKTLKRKAETTSHEKIEI